MINEGYSLLVESSRALLFAFTFLYFYQCFLNFQISSLSKVSGQNTTNRTLLSFCCGMFSLSEYFITYCGGEEMAKFALSSIYFFVILVTYYYKQAMKDYYVGGDRFRKIMGAILLTTLAFHVCASTYQILFDPQFPYLTWEQAHSNNPLIVHSYADKIFQPGILFSLMTISYGSTMFCILIAMLFGYARGKYRDKVILFGVILSITTVSFEMYASTFIPEIFFFIAFIGNYPEVSRITIIAQRKVLTSLGQEIEKNEKLVAIKQQAIERARFKSITNLANGMAHEINNPLAIIAGSMGYIKKHTLNKKLTDDMLLDTVKTVQTTVKRIAKIIGSLRVVSKETDEFKLENIFAKDVLNDVTSICSERYNKNGVVIDIKIETSNEMKEFCCDRIQLSQALVNILDNAFDAAIQNEIKWIRVVVSENGTQDVIRITDSGNGISNEIKDKMFDPFFTSKEIGEGMGLGLSIARSTIERHQGTLELDITSKDTSFVIKIPKEISSTQADHITPLS